MKLIRAVLAVITLLAILVVGGLAALPYIVPTEFNSLASGTKYQRMDGL